MSCLIVVMGVSGSGKTMVGKFLAQQLGIEFIDGDDLHSEENVARMAAGIPLDDVARQPWLRAICDYAESRFAQQQSLVVACSALKKSYRSTLRTVSHPVVFVFLDGQFHLIQRRLSQRQGHFMPVELLESQFAELEDPRGEPGVLSVNTEQSVESMREQTLDKVRCELSRISNRES